MHKYTLHEIYRFTEMTKIVSLLFSFTRKTKRKNCHTQNHKCAVKIIRNKRKREKNRREVTENKKKKRKLPEVTTQKISFDIK